MTAEEIQALKDILTKTTLETLDSELIDDLLIYARHLDYCGKRTIHVCDCGYFQARRAFLEWRSALRIKRQGD